MWKNGRPLPIPVDGIITLGMAGIDQHILTGEAQPVDAEVGDRVFASTVVLTGRIEIEVEKTGSETTAAQIGEIDDAVYKVGYGLTVTIEDKLVRNERFIQHPATRDHLGHWQ